MSKFWIAGLLLARSTSSFACQGNEDLYPARTNVELIERADLIVVGRVDWEQPATAHLSLEVGLTPLRTLKGTAPARLVLYGTTRDRSGELVRSSPTGLHGYHPSASWGSCDRQAYAPGSLVLAAFIRRADKFIQLGDRGVEDVGSLDDVWVRAASLYAKVVNYTAPSRRRRAFQRERELLLATTGDPDAKEIADEIAAYLKAMEREN